MNTDKLQQIQAHAQALAALLYDETAPEQLTTLEGIETAVRGHILEYVSPEVGHFLLQQQAGQAADGRDTSRASLGKSTSAKIKRKPCNSKPEPS